MFTNIQRISHSIQFCTPLNLIFTTAERLGQICRLTFHQVKFSIVFEQHGPVMDWRLVPPSPRWRSWDNLQRAPWTYGEQSRKRKWTEPANHLTLSMKWVIESSSSNVISKMIFFQDRTQSSGKKGWVCCLYLLSHIHAGVCVYFKRQGSLVQLFNKYLCKLKLFLIQ